MWLKLLCIAGSLLHVLLPWGCALAWSPRVSVSGQTTCSPFAHVAHLMLRVQEWREKGALGGCGASVASAAFTAVTNIPGLQGVLCTQSPEQDPWPGLFHSLVGICPS